ncbi:MAG TPA: multicopper oxidase domain-containing protein [Anaerolineales bacterium]|nr:multicopper oxidase domain-containing protein [Anaerolineales bacterium]HNN13167.1 multicopper oxidase domain-containing protein [Anaerolineales bacterium]HNO32041.1 multicopper oxidase domain-containing protein [Anaerolineales bacterium]
MKKNMLSSRLSRRDFLKVAGAGLLVTGGAGVLKKFLLPEMSALAQATPPNKIFAATDGWIHLPPSPIYPPFHPDDLSPDPMFTTYIFGFRDVTGQTDAQILNQKMKAQHSAPLFWLNEGEEFKLELRNLGLQMRPDLTDAHTVHFHGFKNAIPFFDGEPSSSVSVPMNRAFTYVYRPHDPGTYMFHCHVEDVEHVHMGMNGLVYVRPAQGDKFVYNDGDGSTGFDREFAMHLSEVWFESHWADSHIQLPEWSDYKPDYSLLNGRVYPDTIAPNGMGYDSNGDLIPPSSHPELQYQPISSLVTCNAGDRVLLRFSNLGFMQASMTLEGIPMRVVGKDATLLRNGSTDLSYMTNTITIGAGESYDAIFTAPPHSGGSGADVYLLYNRNFNRSHSQGSFGDGQQMTEVRVYPGTLSAQTDPNT